uniref:Putative secreted protein n=1 Tax=Anopheles triannulatus TaxID=58253 RepID=A0A2M4B1R3_9DIPT
MEFGGAMIIWAAVSRFFRYVSSIFLAFFFASNQLNSAVFSPIFPPTVSIPTFPPRISQEPKTTRVRLRTPQNPGPADLRAAAHALRSAHHQGIDKQHSSRMNFPERFQFS